MVPQRNQSSGFREGLFQVAGRLAKGGRLSEAEQKHLDDLREWFGTYLPKPDRFSRKRKAADKNTRGIAWFKDSAHKHIKRMRDLVALLERHDVQVNVVETTRPGYVVYEDDFQVVAEPFAETRT